MFPVRARHKLRVSERMWGRDAGPFEGNDIRIRGGVLKRCVLCGSLTWLRLSHVIPKWAFRWHKNARGGVITTHLYSRGVVTSQQDGNRHYLLCKSCEQWASVGESYALAIVDRNRKALRATGTRYVMLDRYWRLRVDLIARFIAITAYVCITPRASHSRRLAFHWVSERCFAVLQWAAHALTTWRYWVGDSFPRKQTQTTIHGKTSSRCTKKDSLADCLLCKQVGWSGRSSLMPTA